MKFNIKPAGLKLFIIIIPVIVITVIVTLAINLYYLEEVTMFRTDRCVSLTPKNLKIHYEDAYFRTNDGEIINGWFIPAENARITVLYCPGSTGNLNDRFREIIFFHEMGLNLLTFDYRGYGKSSGRPREEGLYRDARAAYDFLVSMPGVDKDNIVVYGRSLGGAVAADLCLWRKARALILQSSFVSFETEARDLYPFLPVGFLLYGRFDTLAKIRNVRIPKLIVHGADDEVVSCDQAELLYKLAPSPKQFISYDGNHDDDVFVTSNEYKNDIEKFFRDNKIF